MYRTDFWTLWEKARVGCSERTALKQVYYQGWNRSPVQVGCMRQVLGAGALGRPRGMGWGGRWEGGSGWGTHVNPWLIHVNVWQKPLQYHKVIRLQLIKINEKKKENVKKTLVRPQMTNFRMIRADCAVSSRSPLPQLIKALAHWLSMRGVGFWTVSNIWNKASFPFHWACLVAQMVKNLRAMQETQVWSLGQESLLEKEMATHSSILAWRILWTEGPGGLQSMRCKELDMTEWLTLSFPPIQPVCWLLNCEQPVPTFQ